MWQSQVGMYLNSGINITITRKTRKPHKCCMCGFLIKKNSMCISAYGFDYDNFKINEKIHPDPKCYDEWIGNIDLMDKNDINIMIEKAKMAEKNG